MSTKPGADPTLQSRARLVAKRNSIAPPNHLEVTSIVPTDAKFWSKLNELARARNEEPEQVRKRFSREQILSAPSFSKHLQAVREQKFAALGLAHDRAWVELEDGHVFFSPISHGSMCRQYEFVGDTLTRNISAETLLAAIDVVQRFVTDAAWPSSHLLEVLKAREQPLTIVELGAYLGHKTVRFGELVKPFGGRVLAVEMMPDNVELLAANIKVNDLVDTVDLRQVGVWNKRGKVVGVGKGRQRRSIHRLDQLTDGEAFEAEVTTLSEILSNWGRSPVDLVFATINGAEVEMLEAYTPSENEVRAWFIAAPYEGNRNSLTGAEYCYDRLVEFGYVPLTERGRRRIEAIKP